MALFDWKQEYSVSVTSFDRDHKKLFSFLNELHQAMAEKRGKIVVVPVLQDLIEYTRTHFAAEEAAMSKANFVDLEHHVAEHHALTVKVQQFYAEYTTANYVGVPIDVLYFLRDWLENHILGTDRKYGEALNSAGIR